MGGRIRNRIGTHASTKNSMNGNDEVRWAMSKKCKVCAMTTSGTRQRNAKRAANVPNEWEEKTRANRWEKHKCRNGKKDGTHSRHTDGRQIANNCFHLINLWLWCTSNKKRNVNCNFQLCAWSTVALVPLWWWLGQHRTLNTFTKLKHYCNRLDDLCVCLFVFVVLVRCWLPLPWSMSIGAFIGEHGTPAN